MNERVFAVRDKATGEILKQIKAHGDYLYMRRDRAERYIDGDDNLEVVEFELVEV